MVHHNPGEPLFTTRFATLLFKKLGYTGQVPKMEVQCACTYDDWQMRLSLKGQKSGDGSSVMQHVCACKWKMRKKQACLSILLPICSCSRKPSWKIWKRNQKRKWTDYHSQAENTGISQSAVAELFKRFPDMDGLVIRHGETYLHDTPFHNGGSPAEHQKNMLCL